MQFNSVSFGDAVQMISGKTPSKQNSAFWNGTVPWISASSMDKFYVYSSGEQITEKALAESGIKYIDEGTPLLLVRGSILHHRVPISIPTRKVTINQDVKALRLKGDALDQDYFVAWLQASEKLLLEKVEFTGIGAGKLDTEVLNKLSIPCPSKKHQIFIGRLGKAINQQIELNNQIDETLESMAKAIFKEWFVDFGPVKAKAEGKKTFGMDDETAALFPDSFEESELGQTPKDWKVTTIDDVCIFQNGYAFKSNLMTTNSEDAKRIFKMGNIVKGGGFNADGSDDYYPNSETQGLDRYLAQKGDLLMCMTDMKNNVALLGNTALMPVSDKYLINQRVGLLRTKNLHKVNYPFLFLLTNEPIFLEELRSRANSGVQVNLSTEEIKKSKFILPSEAIHKSFDKLILPFYEKIESNRIENEHLKNTRDLLLPKLISGEIQLEDQNQ